MENSYAVYHDAKKILFIRKFSDNDPKNTMVESSVHWAGFSRFVHSDKQVLVYTGGNPGKMFREFSTLFHCIDAAGGLVTDPSGYFLFIYRRGRWDLPKGTVEKHETTEKAAIREIEEECGIRELEIVHALPKTYHVYPLDEQRWALKKTHWYFVRTKTCCRAEPQTSEGIMHAEWKHPGNLDEVFESTYANIRELLRLSLPLLNQ